MKIKWGRLISAIALCQLAGIIGSAFTFSAIPTWFATLTKPSFSPPNYLFGPVWIILYTLMGISLYLVWGKKKAVSLFLIQLAVNAGWSIVFFGFKNIGLALVVILVLWVLIVKTIWQFFRINKTASYLLIPYLIWVSFATVLNFSLYLLNR